MEVVDGITLARALDGGPLAPHRAAALGAQLAGALAYVHERGVVHRDVKPANILVDDRTGQAKLTDFGVARLVDGTRLTEAGTTLGTANYLAPEQATGDEVTPACDVYSLGLVLLECLTGSVAFPGYGVTAAVARLHRDPDIPAWLPDGWRGLLAAMTSRKAADRPRSADVAVRLALLVSTGDRAAAELTAPVAVGLPAPPPQPDSAGCCRCRSDPGVHGRAGVDQRWRYRSGRRGGDDNALSTRLRPAGDGPACSGSAGARLPGAAGAHGRAPQRCARLPRRAAGAVRPVGPARRRARPRRGRRRGERPDRHFDRPGVGGSDAQSGRRRRGAQQGRGARNVACRRRPRSGCPGGSCPARGGRRPFGRGRTCGRRPRRGVGCRCAPRTAGPAGPAAGTAA